MSLQAAKADLEGAGWGGLFLGGNYVAGTDSAAYDSMKFPVLLVV